MPPRIAAQSVKLKRAYETPGPEDGTRVLIDRLWPRGVSKEAAALHSWRRELAPSDALRQWFGHDSSRWADFQHRYRSELAARQGAVAELRDLAAKGTLTLVYAARDTEHNDAVVLRDVILRRSSPRA